MLKSVSPSSVRASVVRLGSGESMEGHKCITMYLISCVVFLRGMLRRPKPTDSEADLLREQERFLTSGAPAAASVVRRPDKRRGEAGGEGGDHNGEDEERQRDVVTIEGKRCVCFYRLIYDIL